MVARLRWAGAHNDSLFYYRECQVQGVVVDLL